MTADWSRASDPFALLAEPVRRRLYDFVAAAPRPVDRDEAAAGLGIGRPLAAFHLDRLVRGGLLAVEYRRRSGRSGPGAGRPAKFYVRAPGAQVDVSLPPRRYGFAAGILADGLERSGEAAVGAVLDAARAAGAELAEDARMRATANAGAAVGGTAAVVDALVAGGYQPFTDADGTIRLRNCPFDALVDGHRALTCSMNLALLGTVVEQLAPGELSAEARPTDGFCCVAVVPSSRRS